MEQGERWLSLAIFFSFYRINFMGRCDTYESHLPLIWTIYCPTAPKYLQLKELHLLFYIESEKSLSFFPARFATTIPTIIAATQITAKTTAALISALFPAFP